VTLNITSNQANGGLGGGGGNGGNATGGASGSGGTVGAAGGSATGGNGSTNALGGNGLGGGLFNSAGATLFISPRENAAPGSSQSGVTDSITLNQANRGFGGGVGGGGSAVGGAPAAPSTATGTATNGHPGTGLAFPNSGSGGGLFLDPAGSAFISNTAIQGNQASTNDSDLDGTFMPAP
jgi:hypothetical protein